MAPSAPFDFGLRSLRFRSRPQGGWGPALGVVGRLPRAFNGVRAGSFGYAQARVCRLSVGRAPGPCSVEAQRKPEEGCHY
jgi:hypothetical protein